MEMVEEEVQNQPNEPTQKRIKINEEEDEEEDRISPMLDCLIVEIISRLPTTKEAIRTGSLSKRWEHLWPSVSNLIFHNPYDNVTRQGHSPSTFFSFVDKTIKKCRQLKLKKLELTSTYDPQFESLVNSWLHYAMERNVEELTLVLWSKEIEAQFVLDELFFICSSFTHLKLKACTLNPNGVISWNKLMNLSLQFVELDEDLIQNILSGSPLLETLRLELCYGYTRLDITSKNVKKLVFCGYNPPFANDTEVIEINAPNIISLAIENMLSLQKLVFLNVSSLVKAKLNYRNVPNPLPDEENEENEENEEMLKEYIDKENKENEEMLKQFILSLRHVKELTIGKFCQKVLSRLEAKGFTLPSGIKYQTAVENEFCGFCLLGI